MRNFRLVSHDKQSTEYTCGPSALQAVLRYWGKDGSEAELAKLLKTTAEVGTDPESIARGATTLGFQATAKSDLTLEEVEKFTAQGHPMIALAQVWRVESSAGKAAEDEWGTGHYIVVLGVDEKNVYYEDPYASMSKAFIPRKAFEAHWHHRMQADKPALMHLGIFIRGNKPAATARPKATVRDLAKMDFQKLGSMNLIVMQFARQLMPFDFMTELKDIWRAGQVRPTAFFVLRKDKKGRLTGIEGANVGQEDIEPTNALLVALANQRLGRSETIRSRAKAAVRASAGGDFGLPMSELQAFGRGLKRDHTAVVVLIENMWERRLKEIVAKHQGSIASQRLISSLPKPARRSSPATAAGSATDPVATRLHH